MYFAFLHMYILRLRKNKNSMLEMYLYLIVKVSKKYRMHLSVNGHFVFRVFDINNDGAISLKELKRIVKDLFHLINEKVNFLFVKKIL